MIQFPNTLTPTKYPGYYWCVRQEKLYSIKVEGVLNELKRRPALPHGYGNYALARSRMVNEAHYQVSVKGHRRYLFVKDLKELKLEPQVLPLPA